MTKKVDVVIIGSGPSGSVAGAYLAKGGLKTVVFESLSQVGGGRWGTHEIAPGFLADDGSHAACWQLSMHGGRGCWPKAAREVGASVRWQCLPNTAIFILGDKPGEGMFMPTPYCSTGKTFVDDFCSRSPVPVPEEVRGKVILILDELLSLPDEELWSEELEVVSFADWLDRRGSDESVRWIFETILAGYLTGENVLANISVASVCHGLVRGLLSGESNYVGFIGGAQDSLPRAFADVITRHGGQVLLDCPVKRVIIDGGEARGVVVSTPEEKEETYEARYVVVATQYRAVPKLLGKDMPQEFEESFAEFDRIQNGVLEVRCAMDRIVWTRPEWGVYLLDQTGKWIGNFTNPQVFDPAGIYNPPGKQQLMLMMSWPVGELKEMVEKRGIEDIVEERIDLMEKVAPGFKENIIARTYRVFYGSWAEVFSTAPNIPLECPGISRLFFAGNYVKCRGWATERSAESAAVVAKRILRREGKVLAS